MISSKSSMRRVEMKSFLKICLWGNIILIVLLVLVLFAPSAHATVWDDQGMTTPIDHKCMNAFLDNARMNPDNATYLRDVWKEAGLDPQVCNEINGHPENYNEYH
jgi:hypothetical protein